MADDMSPGPRAPSLREASAALTRARILDAVLPLVEAGEEPTMRAVAKAAGVAERTIYRYFASKDELHEEVSPRFYGRAGVPLCASFEGLPAYARELYATFDANERLNVTLLTASWAVPLLHVTRRRGLGALRALVDAAFPAAPSSERAAAAASLRAMLSGGGWMYLRISCSIPPVEAVAHLHWLIDTIAARLGRSETTHS